MTRESRLRWSQTNQSSYLMGTVQRSPSIVAARQARSPRPRQSGQIFWMGFQNTVVNETRSAPPRSHQIAFLERATQISGRFQSKAQRQVSCPQNYFFVNREIGLVRSLTS